MEIGLIGSRVRMRRLELGRKQSDLARAVGISAAYLNLIEHNRRRISADLLTQFATALEVEEFALSVGAAPSKVEQVMGAASSVGVVVDTIAVQNLVERFPIAADIVLAQENRLKSVEATLEHLSDRLSHDPFLSDALHEIVSTVSSIRSTSSILLDGDGMDPGLDLRFRKNIHSDSLRLASATQALANSLDLEDESKSESLSPHDEVFRVLESIGFHHVDLETSAMSVSEFLDAHFSELSLAGQSVARKYIESYLRFSRLLPLSLMVDAVDRHGLDPSALSRTLDVSYPVIFRRLASMPPDLLGVRIGLVVVDIAGRVLHRQATDGFDVPRAGSVCALWPTFRALQAPDMPHKITLSQIRRAAAGASQTSSVTTFTAAEPVGAPDFGLPQHYQAIMMMIPENSDANDPDLRVGTSCRVCQHATCVLRGEPSILTDGF